MIGIQAQITVKFIPRVTFESHPFTEILHTVEDETGTRHFCSRVWWVVQDTPHGRGGEIAAFKKRQAA